MQTISGKPAVEAPKRGGKRKGASLKCVSCDVKINPDRNDYRNGLGTYAEEGPVCMACLEHDDT